MTIAVLLSRWGARESNRLWGGGERDNMKKTLLQLAVFFVIASASAYAQSYTYQSYTQPSVVGGYTTTTYGSNGSVYQSYTRPSAVGGYSTTTYGSSGYTSQSYSLPSLSGGYNTTTFVTPSYRYTPTPTYSTPTYSYPSYSGSTYRYSR
jgi:hypothetical protein